MKIGIIGAGIAGLVAGKELALAGHEVTLIEKEQELGGRLATWTGENPDVRLDYGIPWFTAESPEFRKFTAEMLEEGTLRIWGDGIRQHEGRQILETRPDSLGHPLYTAPAGIHSVIHKLSRYVDVLSTRPAGGITYIGANRGRKRAWMINLTNFNTFEADAIIIATPAPEAYGLLLTVQDETGVLKLIREIDEVNYDPAFALLTDYGEIAAPKWEGLMCADENIRFISNENTKRSLPGTSLMVQTTSGFARAHRQTPREEVTQKILQQLSGIVGEWATSPQWSHLHFWRFFQTRNVIHRPFMELDRSDAPLAVAGDYFEGKNIDASYRSGLKLARHWIEKYRD